MLPGLSEVPKPDEGSHMIIRREVVPENEGSEFHIDQLSHFTEMKRMINEGFTDRNGYENILTWIEEQILYHQGRISELRSKK